MPHAALGKAGSHLDERLDPMKRQRVVDRYHMPGGNPITGKLHRG